MIKGFKAMDKNMMCRGFQFKEGKTYTETKVELCNSGFHFCKNVMDVYSYYPKTEDTIICEIEALGEVKDEGDKSATNKIKIVRKLSDKEVLAIWIKRNNSGDWNSGDWNSGYGNSGNRNSGNRNSGDGNSGDWNSGYGNSGNWNSGDWNSGNRNSGDGNSGDWNSGDWNSGDWNSGYGNSGNRNSGDWNSGDGNSGYFNTEVPLYFFNKPSVLKYTDDLSHKLRSLNVKPILEWIPTSLMSEKEKVNNPKHVTTEGFLRKTERHDWRYLTEADKAFIKSLPNFDDSIFQQISGVSLSDDIEITLPLGEKRKISKVDAKKLGLID